jgi:hypothetical protein
MGRNPTQMVICFGEMIFSARLPNRKRGGQKKRSCVASVLLLKHLCCNKIGRLALQITAGMPVAAPLAPGVLNDLGKKISAFAKQQDILIME